MKYRIAKGVFDILPKDPDPKGNWRESHLWQHVESQMAAIAKEFGFHEIRTPIFETTELFQRSIGSTTDIVTKEMYTFHDKGGRMLTLRPEGTAPVMRAFIEKSLDQISSIQKVFYIVPMFRYERQQAGRYRQHHQFGVEAIGSDAPAQDVEVIDLLYSLFQRLGLQGLTLQLNSIGNLDSRKKYRHELKHSLHPYFDELSPESQERYHTNPLRILDSKNPHDKKLLLEAPTILDFLDDEAKGHFEEVRHLLDLIEIPYVINSNLVRGLDYYTKTVFEITSEQLGAQNSLGGGGRYNGLIKELGGPDLPAFGFGAGLERIIQTMLAQKVSLPPPQHSQLFLIPLGDSAKEACFKLASQLRKEHIATEMDLSGKKLKSAMRYADTIGARYVAVVGENELESKQLELKEMASGKVEKVSFSSLVKRLKNG